MKTIIGHPLNQLVLFEAPSTGTVWAPTDSADTMDVIEERGGTENAATPDEPSARRSYMPSSMGLSFLVARESSKYDITVT